MKSQWQIYKELELIADEIGNSRPSLQSRVWSYLKHLMAARNHTAICGFEINGFEVYKVCELGTPSWWYADNRTTGQTVYLESEQDLHQWLEEQYQQTHKAQ